MTIICARDGIIAGDTGTWGGSSSSIKLGKTRKISIAITLNGNLSLGPFAAAACGTSSACASFRTLFVQDKLKERDSPIDEDFEALIIGIRDIWWVDSRLRLVHTTAPFVAIGAAQDFALGALAMGASARRAVELTISHTADAWGEVDFLDLRAAEQSS